RSCGGGKGQDRQQGGQEDGADAQGHLHTKPITRRPRILWPIVATPVPERTMPRQMHKALVILAYALGLLASLAAIVAFPAGIFLLAQVERTLHAETYRPATFTVAWVAYRPSGRRTTSSYWAIGTIDGHRERYPLGDVVV